MNKGIYKTIYSAALQQIIVTWEYARGKGKSHGGHSRRTLGIRIRLLPACIALACGLSPQLLWAESVISEDDRAPAHERPVILKTANGLPQIDIQTPDASGISMNRYSRFDIDAAGAVMNNARKDSATLSGGVVAGNPHLAKGEAALIVNQVRSQDPSHLQGMVEIAGQKADVIVANPAGLMVNGGFINAGKVQYTAGQVTIERGSPVQHSAPNGLIEITPGGLNAQQHDYTTLLARQIKLNGEIQAGAGQVDLITGNNSLGADGSITPKNTDGQHAAPRFAVDSSALGGMYAGRIRLIGTEQGVGVHHAGTLQTESLNIQLPGTLENSGNIRANALDIQLENLQNSGELRHNSNNTLYLRSNAFSNRDTATLQARTAGQDQANKNTPEAPNNADNKNSNAIGRITASGKIDNRGNISSGGNIDLNTRDYQNSGTVAISQITLRDGKFDNRGGTSHFENADIRASSLDNRSGTLNFERAKPIIIQGQLDNHRGSINSTAPLDISAGQISNTGGGNISSATTLSLYARRDIASDGSISAGSSANLKAGQNITNSGLISAGEALALDAGNNIENSGSLYAGSTLDLNAGNTIDNSGNISGELLNISADSLENRERGTITQRGPYSLNIHTADYDTATSPYNSIRTQKPGAGANSATGTSGGESAGPEGSLKIRSSFNNRGVFEINNLLSVTASKSFTNHQDSEFARLTLTQGANLDNSHGTLRSQSMRFDAGDINNQHGSLQTNTLHLKSQNLDNRFGRIEVADKAEFNISKQWDNSHGQVKAGTLRIDSIKTSNDGGSISAQNNLHLYNRGHWDNGSGQLLAGGDMALNDGTLDNRGRIQAGSELKYQNFAQLNQQGELYSNNIALHGKTLSNSGTTASAQHITIHSDTTENSGKLSATETLTVNSQNVNNRGELQAGGDIGLQAQSTTNSGRIVSNQNSRISGEKLDNSGLIHAQQQLYLRNRHLKNSGTAAASGETTIDTAELDNNGKLAGKTRITVNTPQFANKGGNIGSDQEVIINTPELDNSQGQIASRGRLTLNVAGNINNSGGVLATEEDWHIKTPQLNNNGGNIHSGKKLHIETPKLDNTGGSIDGSEYHLQSSDINNQGGHLIGRNKLHIETDGEQLNNQGGQIVSQDELRIDGKKTTIDSSGGYIVGNNLNVDVDSVKGGKVESWADLQMRARRIDDLEEVHTGGNMDIQTEERYTFNAPHYSGGWAKIGAKEGITFTPDAKFEFKENAEITSDGFINNEGQIAAYGTLLLKAGTTIENRHRAKIQGGHVAMEAQSLKNFDGATIAAADRIDLAAGEIINEGSARIESVGGLHVGRTLDGNHQATGQADLLRNDNNGEINVDGDATFNAARIENLDSQKFVGQKTLSTKVWFYSDMWTRDKWIPEELRTQDLTVINNRFPYLYDYTLQDIRDVAENRAAGLIKVGGNLTVNADSANNEGHIAAGSIDGNAQNLLNGSEWTGARVIRVEDGRYGEYRPYSNHPGPWIGDYLMFGQYTAPEIHETITVRLGSTNFGGVHNGNRYDGTGGGGVPSPGGNGGGNGGGGNNGTTIVDTIDKNGKTVTYQTISDYQPALPQNSLYQINPDNIAAPDSIPTNPARGLYTLDPTFARILQKRRPELFENGELMRTPMNPHYDRYSDPNDKGAAYSGTTQGVPYIDFSRSIGDRYYNQELVRNQIARLTGYRYLKGYQDDSSQFNALVAAGERLRAKLQLAPGVALTAEHMKSLSEDVVLMVNKTITLPDGRQIVRQVPQVYAQKRPDDLDTSRPTIGANRIALKGNYHNNAGDIGGRDTLKLYYRNIDHSGTYTSNHGDVHASDTYNGSAGTINAGKYFKATAGKQFNFQPKTADHNENAAKDAGKSYHNSHTITAEGQLKRYATGSTVILGEADETNIGTTALDLGDKTSTTLIQGKKTDLGAEFVYEQTLDKKDAGNYDYHYRGEHKGVHTSGDGKLAVIATDGKLTMKAAELDSGKSQVYLYGAKGVDAEAGEIVEHTISARESKQRGFLKRTHTRDYVETEIHQNKAGTITGDTVVVAAGQGDINATGMHIVSDHGTMLHTDKGDINLKAGKNSYRSVEKHSKHKTGLMGSGGWGVFLGSRRQSGETELNIKAPAPTLVGAIDGNIHIQAGGHYDGTGALVHAGREGGPLTKEQWLQMSETERNRAGNIYFSAESGSLRAARGSQDHEMHSHYKQTGFTANLGGAVVNVAQTALQTMKTLSDGDNARVRTMNTLNNTWANYKGIEALSKALNATSEKPDSNLINIQISLGGQHSTVHHKAHEDTLLPSQMTGDSGVYVDIKGKGEGSTLDVISSDLAGSAITRLNVEGKKTFAADSVKKTIESSQHSGGGGGGIAIMLGSNGGGLGVIANANIGKGKTNGNSTTYRLSHIGGLQGHTDIGDGKTLINGAQLLGKSLEGNTRDLVAISPQGTMDYDSNNFALSGFVLYGAGAALGIDYEKTRVTAHEKTINKESGGRDAITSVSSNNARINAWKKDVQQNDAVANAQQDTLGGQSGFFAGDDGFRIKNSGTATLEGATFVSTAKAEAEGKNHFSTDRLIRKDLENHSEYKGKSVALGLSAVLSGDKNNGTSQQIQWLGENFSPINVGESGMSNRFGYDRTNKNDRGTTYASINTANITINDAAGQQALTGESVADTIRNANRGMTLATAKEQSGAADAHFDAAKVENSVRTNAQVMKTFTGTVQDVKGDLRKWAEENRREAIYQRDPEKRAAQLQRAEQQEQLAVAVDMLGGALTPTNSVAGGIANTLAPAITHKIGQEIKKRGLEGTPEHIALHTVMAGARTALNGGSTGEVLASAAITGTAEYSTPQLAKLLYNKDISQLTAAEKSALGQTIGALTTGAGAMTGGNSATTYNAGKTAQNAVENNWLSTSQLIDIDKRYHDCGTDELCKQDVIYTAQLMSHSQDTDLTIAKVKCFFGYCDTLDQYIGERVKAADLNIAYKELKKYYPYATEEDLRNAAKYYSDEAVRSFDTSTGRTLIGALDASPAVGLAGSGAREATSAIKQAFKNGAARAVLRNAEVTAAEAASREAVLNSTAHGAPTAKDLASIKYEGTGASGIGPWGEGVSNVVNKGVFVQCADGSCVSATAQILSKGKLSEAQALSELGEWADPLKLPSLLNKAESKGTPWVGGYFASGEDAIKVASKGEMGAILQSPTVGAHMVTITPIKTKPGKFRVQDTGVGKTYDVDSNWIEKFVSAGVWRNE